MTFPSVVIAWVFFRATTFSRAWEILSGMFGLNGATLPPNYMPLALGRKVLSSLGVDFVSSSSWSLIGGKREILLIAICIVMVLVLPNSYQWCQDRFRKKRFSTCWAIAIGGVLAISICYLDRISEFLYFQF